MNTDNNNSAGESSIRVPMDTLVQFTHGVFRSVGLTDADSSLAATLLVEADLCGVHSHGVSRLAVYLDCFRRRVLNAVPKITVSPCGPSVATIDGDNALGLLVAKQGMDYAVQIAKTTGVGVVLARRSSHFGMAATYVRTATDQGLAAIVGSNAPPVMVPWNGVTAKLGTNPIAGGVPGTTENGPFVFDMATSVVARGWITLAARNGSSIPDGWAIDCTGRPTTDPKAALAGSVLPFAGAKGFALAAFVDLLAGVMSGASYAENVGSVFNKHNLPVNIGHFFIAIDVARFLSPEQYTLRYNEFVRSLKSASASEVQSVRMPGDRALATKIDHLQFGIPLSASIMADLSDVAAKCGLDLDVRTSKPKSEANGCDARTD